MRSNSVPAARPAFTLLEMLLATAIAVLLLGALYVAMDLQLRQAENSREVIEQSTLARSLLNRMASDIAPSVGMADPSRYQQQGGQSGGGGSGASGASGGGTSGSTGQSSGAASGSAGTTGTGSSGSSTGSGTGSGSGSGSGSSSTTSATAIGNGPTLLFLVGDANTLTLYISRVPPNSAASATNPVQIADERRVYYWLSSRGLARQELTQVTADDAGYQQAPPETPDANDANSRILAPEVKSLQFQYFDGTNWNDSWDGTTLGSDGVTPIGPPVAVAITLGIARPGAEDEEVRTYRHVIAIQTANGATQSTSSSNGSSSSTP
jgi:prepilin-type N-terminal cleavage/methylation domain-containing protein